MKRRLLIDLEVLQTLAAIPLRTRRRLWKRIEELQEFPDRYAEYQEKTPDGRDADVNVHAGFAISYWDDFADRHVKVLHIGPADR